MLKLQMLTNWMGVLFNEVHNQAVPGCLYNDVVPSGLNDHVRRELF